MNILFICTYNRWRSLTAEKMFANRRGVRVKSAGIASTARVKVTSKIIKWSDLIFVMEARHRDYLFDNFSDLVEGKQIICLDIPSGYRYNEPELIELLKHGTEEFF